MSDLRTVTDLMAPGQAARRLGYSREHITRLARQGRLKGIPTPLGMVFDVGEVERFAAEQRQRAERDARIRASAPDDP